MQAALAVWWGVYYSSGARHDVWSVRGLVCKQLCCLTCFCTLGSVLTGSVGPDQTRAEATGQPTTATGSGPTPVHTHTYTYTRKRALKLSHKLTDRHIWINMKHTHKHTGCAQVRNQHSFAVIQYINKWTDLQCVLVFVASCTTLVKLLAPCLKIILGWRAEDIFLNKLRTKTHQLHKDQIMWCLKHSV